MSWTCAVPSRGAVVGRRRHKSGIPGRKRHSPHMQPTMRRHGSCQGKAALRAHCRRVFLSCDTAFFRLACRFATSSARSSIASKCRSHASQLSGAGAVGAARDWDGCWTCSSSAPPACPLPRPSPEPGRSGLPPPLPLPPLPPAPPLLPPNRLPEPARRGVLLIAAEKPCTRQSQGAQQHALSLTHSLR